MNRISAQKKKDFSIMKNFEIKLDTYVKENQNKNTINS